MQEPSVKLRVKIPRELYEDVLTNAKINYQAVSLEVITMLAYSLEHNDVVMSHDRLMRLIFAPSLAPEAE